LFAGGLTGFKSVLSTALQTLAIASMISIVWLMFGYSLAFGVDFDGGNNRFIGGANKFWFRGDGKGAGTPCWPVARLSFRPARPAPCLPFRTAPSALALLHRRAGVFNLHVVRSLSGKLTGGCTP